MVHLTIDGLPIDVEAGTKILDAAKQVGIKIPTLCYHEDLSIKAVCRICVVEVEGMRLLQTACSTPVTEGMVIHTTSPKVLEARRRILELIFARHPQDCLVCAKSGRCELQKVAQDLGMHNPIPYALQIRSEKSDYSSPSILRNPQKCILCGRCMEMCNDIQKINVLAKENRGFHTKIGPIYGEKLEDTNCIGCGQCVQVCPTGALTIRYYTNKLRKAQATGKRSIVQVAPSVRVTLAEALGEQPGTISTGRLVTALKRLGFWKVFDSNFSADLTIMEEGTELLNRIQKGGKLPMMTSCCPGWVKYCEINAPDLLGNLSTAKSPQQMFGAMIKTWFAKRENIPPAEILSCSIMPCTAKKFECQRPEMQDSGYQDVDYVLTVVELADMIRAGGIDFANLPETPFDDLFGTGSGAGAIFGTTGGVMEAALRTVYCILTGEEMKPLTFQNVRGFEGIKESRVTIGNMEMKVAVAHGIANAQIIIDQIRKGAADYQFVEVMACPGGCIGGGGNPPKTWKKLEARKAAIYQVDKDLPVRYSHKNPTIAKVYEEFLGEPNGELSHKLLHTSYVNRQDLADY